MEKNNTEVWIDDQGAVFSADKQKLLHCPDVEEYVIPNHAEYISPYAFDTAPRLKKIDFNRVREIPERKETSEFEVPDFHGGGWYGDYSTAYHDKYHGLFEKCPLVEKVEFGECMTRIAPYALAGLKNVKSLNTRAGIDITTLLGLDSLKELATKLIRPHSWYPSWSDYSIDFVDSNGREVKQGGNGGYARWERVELLPSLETCYFYDVCLSPSWLFNIICELASCKNIKQITLPKFVKEELDNYLRKRKDSQKDSLHDLPLKNGSGQLINYLWE